MENINTDFDLKKLEFDKILEQITKCTLSREGAIRILASTPARNYKEVLNLHNLLNKLKDYFINEENLSVSIIYNFGNQLNDAQKNIIIKEIPLYELSYSIDVYFSLLKKFKNDKYKELLAVFHIDLINDNFYKDVLKYFDHEGNIDDNITSALKKIRSRINIIYEKIRKTANDFYKYVKQLGYIAEDIVSVRDGFSCVCIKSSFKNKVDGIVLDTSSSGQTVFIAPKKVIELHNDLIILQDEERKEINRILNEYTLRIRNIADDLKTINEDLIIFDVLYAKTRFTLENEYNSPDIIEDKYLNILSGKHPLLGKNAVPLDMRLGRDYRILLITGPNTGGKTVALKTIGIFSLMVQCGIGIPASSTSKFCVFKKIFVDIGDEQSIEQSLSTFSGHVKKIINIINRTDSDSLILIDEFGAGTDPVEGSALAMSILNHILKIKSFAVMTTHYSALKHFASEHDGIENASVEFDSVNLKPTYKLRIGIPGSSKALEIAKRLGMPDKIINSAKSLINEEHLNVEKLSEKLEQERIQYENDRNTMIAEKEKLEKKETALKNELLKIKEKDNELKQLFKSGESQFLKDARKEFEALVKKIKTEKASKDVIKEGKSFFNKIDEVIALQDKKINKEKLVKEFKPGDEVVIISKDIKGTILDKTNEEGEYLVQVGLLKMNFHSQDLKLAKKKKNKNDYDVSYQKVDTITSQMTYDIRGCRYEEAEKKISKFIEEALMNNLSVIKIIHGKGTGALRRCIHDFLQTSPYVTDFDYEKINDAVNYGVTVAYLR